MKFSTLLGAGKSFFGGRGSISYRANKDVYLPKFNADKNPFAPKTDAAEKSAQKISTPPAPRPVRATSWTDKINPFRAPEPAAPAAVKVEQVEFSLDAVKVLHNDLSDAEVEFVPVKSRNGPPPSAPAGFLDEHVLRIA